MGFLDKAKKMAEKAGPLIDKAAPHARTVADKAGQQIDKRTGGKYRDKIEQVEQKVGEYADKRMSAGGMGPAADEGFPPTPPPATTAEASAPTAAGTPPDTTPTPPGSGDTTGTPTPPPPAAEPQAPSDRPTP